MAVNDYPRIGGTDLPVVVVGKPVVKTLVQQDFAIITESAQLHFINFVVVGPSHRSLGVSDVGHRHVLRCRAKFECGESYGVAHQTVVWVVIHNAARRNHIRLISGVGIETGERVWVLEDLDRLLLRACRTISLNIIVDIPRLGIANLSPAEGGETGTDLIGGELYRRHTAILEGGLGQEIALSE